MTFHRFLVAFSVLFVCTAFAQADELYRWRPVRLGAGGLVTGFVTHPLDAGARYCRTDVGNAYRWSGGEWRPMLVRDGRNGLPAELTAAPAVCGVESIAIDPRDPHIVYLAFSGTRPESLKKLYPSLPGNIYKSTDGGVTFTSGTLALTMEPNGRWRGNGERLKVDPLNGRVLYYGSVKQGLHRSADGGATWHAVTGGDAPAGDANVLEIHFGPRGGTVTRDGAEVCKNLYAVALKGAVFQSADGGATWQNISAGQPVDGACVRSVFGPDDSLWVVAEKSGVPNLWQYRDGAWTSRVVSIWGGLNSLAFHPKDPSKIVAIGNGGAFLYSTDGGLKWTAAGHDMVFAKPFGWLPQPRGYRANTALHFDAAGTLWLAQGNEGMLRCVPAFRETDSAPPQWEIDSAGIEEFVTHDVILPPDGDAVFAVEDATGLVSANVDKFVARQIPLQDQLLSNGTGLAWCPNAPRFLAIVTADIFHTGSGKSYSGFSSDGGKTWQPFAGGLSETDSGKPLPAAGSIAVSRRGAWGTGSDHLVWLPNGKAPTYWSHDGGASWHASTGFPLGNGYWQFSLKQRVLAADPFVTDRFFFIGTWNGGFYVSSDGGKSWEKQENAGLPVFNHHAQLATNRAVQDDLWFCDGWDGASQHGLWHSTDGGRKFTKLDGIEYVITLCTGAPRSQAGDAPFSIYFYGKMSATPDWGIFRSTNAGASWERVAFYPAGIFDQPTCMSASWDEFGKVIVGFGGNSFVVGTPK